MRTHTYRTIDVAVKGAEPTGDRSGAGPDDGPSDGGTLRVGIWDPVEPGEGADVPTALLIHGVTASHLAWPFVVEQLPGHRLIAPDLRGRGGSRHVGGASSMSTHAQDMLAVLDACGAETAAVVGHSMGAFVAVVLADASPARVSHLVLVDGGLPFDLPASTDLGPEQLVHAILGPTAERLSMQFADVEDYFDFWRDHPAFQDAWSDEVEEYFAYDLVPADTGLRPSTSLRTTIEDTFDLHTGATLPAALARLVSGPERTVRFYTVPRGLQDEEPGLYAPEYIDTLLADSPAIDHRRLEGLNHYTVVMSQHGAARLGDQLREAFEEAPEG